MSDESEDVVRAEVVLPKPVAEALEAVAKNNRKDMKERMSTKRGARGGWSIEHLSDPDEMGVGDAIARLAVNNARGTRELREAMRERND
jgi:hypothetical protein